MLLCLVVSAGWLVFAIHLRSSKHSDFHHPAGTMKSFTVSRDYVAIFEAR
jgi:hypothetical protein